MSTACGYSEAVYSTTIKFHSIKSPFAPLVGAFFLSLHYFSILVKIIYDIFALVLTKKLS